MGMKRVWWAAGLSLVMGGAGAAGAEQPKSGPAKPAKGGVTGTAVAPAAVPPADSTTEGSVTVGGQAIAYKAVAGTITVGATDVQDALIGLDGKMLPDTGVNAPDAAKPEDAPATARMFYAAYF